MKSHHPNKTTTAKPTQSYPPPCESQIILTFQIPFLTKNYTPNKLFKEKHIQTNPKIKQIPRLKPKVRYLGNQKTFPPDLCQLKKKTKHRCRSLIQLPAVPGRKMDQWTDPGTRYPVVLSLGGKIYINHLVFQLPTIPIFPGDDAYELVDLN